MQWMPSHTGLSHAPPPARIESISAEVDLSGVRRRVSFVLTPEVRVGEYVLIHSGLAISILDEDEAEETLKLFLELEQFTAQVMQEQGCPVKPA